MLLRLGGPIRAIPLGHEPAGEIVEAGTGVIASQGYPTEIFQVTPELAAHAWRFAKLISHRVPFTEAGRAFDLALTHGAAEKVIVTFGL